MVRLRKIRQGFPVAAVLSGLLMPAGIQAGDGVADTGGTSLKWTPHRAAVRPLETEAPSKAFEPETAPPIKARTIEAAPAVSAMGPPAVELPGEPNAASTLPPATVFVPDRIPTINSRSYGSTQRMKQVPRATDDEVAPLRREFSYEQISSGMEDWFSVNRIAGSFRGGKPDPNGGPLGLGMMRSPQGNTGRPILAQERPPALGNRLRPADDRLGGGVAPRFDPTADRRPERLAMDINAMPSVMARAPQAAAVQPRPEAPAGDAAAETVTTPPLVIETTPGGMSNSFDAFEHAGPPAGMPMDEGMWQGQYPAELHVESFFDDPYACEEECGPLPWHFCDGRVCGWLRRFGRPYYGWRWYRDLTASVGVTAFENETGLGLFGNYGTNEYINWSMPFWNAFGVGWQVGVRGVQTNFGKTTVTPTVGQPLSSRSRNETFVTTGFFTRAFEGRGLQGGAVYDYLHDSFFENADVSQIRGEISYVWGYHELGFWGGFNVGQQRGLFGRPVPPARADEATTLNLYTAFYRMQFGDANEWKLWGGASDSGNGYIGSLVRASMSRSLSLEGNFAYLMPGRSRSLNLGTNTLTTTPMAWNLSVNLVYYPACRSRRSLSSPYRPLFDVADNGTLIQSISRLSP